MTQTLDNGTDTITPLHVRVSPYGWSSAMPTVEHQLLGGGVSYSLRPGGPRKNQLELEFNEQAAAFAAFEDLRAPAVWSYTDSEVPESDMNLVVVGQLGISPYMDEPGHWIVTVPVSEIAGGL